MLSVRDRFYGVKGFGFGADGGFGGRRCRASDSLCRP